MPWEIRDGGDGCPFEVVKQDTGDRVACHDTKGEALAHMRALYASESGAMMSRAAIGDVIELDQREATVGGVNFPDRIIQLVAAPYESPTQVFYRDQLWTETIARGAFAGIERKQKIRVNRDHERQRTVGKVVGYYPDRPEGLVVEAYISRTALGDETLQLADDDALSGSVGMAVRSGDQTIDTRNKTRTIRRAFLDHLALTPDPAYEGARILSVRSAMADGIMTSDEVKALQRQPAPGIEEYRNDPIFQWASERLSEDRATTEKPYGDVKYADPGYKNDIKRYPIDSADHCRAAWSYINMPKNQAGYTPEQVAEIKGRIKAAAKRFGVDISGD